MDLVEDIKLFIINPKKAFKKKAKTSYKSALKYAALLLLFYTFLSVIVALASTKVISSFMPSFSTYKTLSAAAIILSAPLTYVSEFIAILLVGIWFHLFARIFGAKKGFKQTLKAIAYGRTPYYLFAWIPVIGIVANIWSWVLYGLGIKEFHKLSKINSILVVVLGILIPTILLLTLIAVTLILLPNLFGAGELNANATNFTLPFIE